MWLSPRVTQLLLLADWLQKKMWAIISRELECFWNRFDKSKCPGALPVLVVIFHLEHFIVPTSCSWVSEDEVTSDLHIKITGDFYEIVLIIFIEILEIGNFWADSFPHSPFKLLQQISSTKKFNDSAVMSTRFVSRFFSFDVEPCFFVRCLFNLVFCHCTKILKDHLLTSNWFWSGFFTIVLFFHRKFSVLWTLS